MSSEAIHITATSHTPEIIINPEKKLFTISGRSLPEEVMDVYQSVLLWVDANAEKIISENFTVSINLFYFNSPTARVLHKIFKKLDSHYAGQPDFSVQWHYENEEELDDAHDLIDELRIPVTFIKTEEEQ
jgi:hypothetical protein